MLSMSRPAWRFIVFFILYLIVFSLILQMEAVHRGAVVPLTGIVARASSLLLNVLGLDTQVLGTVITGSEAFSVNILDGCNGVDVMAIVAAAVLAFPSSFKEKLLGLAMAMPGVQIINVVRIVSLYYIGLRWPALFERFHLYVWQTAVILLSLTIWMVWARFLTGERGAPARPHEQTPSAS